VADEGEGVLHTHYDGVTNDLLTAGLGKTGLGSVYPKGPESELTKAIQLRLGELRQQSN
jgi:hypothetical protein